MSKSSGCWSGQAIVTRNSALLSTLPSFASGAMASSAIKNRKAENLQRLEQHHREWIERLLLRHEVEFVDHSAASGRFSRTETTRTSVRPTASANSFAVASSSM